MENWFYALMVKSLVLFAFMLIVGFTVVAVKNWLPSGKLKSLLLSDPTDWAADSVARRIKKSSSETTRK